MSEIVIKKCDDYDYDNVKEGIYGILNQAQVCAKIKSGMNVVVKANLLSKKTPDQCVTTNPEVIRAVCEYIASCGAKAIITDSPAGPFNENALKAIYGATGMAMAAKNSGAQLNYDTSYKNVKLANAKTLDKIDIITSVVNADMIINVAKLKTHVMMTYTGAVKNLYGVIPGLTKAAYHMKLQEPDNFANHLIDICEFVKPDFSIIDGIHAMEGDGPNSGEKVEFGFLLGGSNPYELDSVASTMIGMKKTEVPTLVNAQKRGLVDDKNITIILDEEDEEYVAIDMDEFTEYVSILELKPFKKPKIASVNFLSGRVPKSIEKYLVEKSKSKPYFIKDKCIGCGHCVRNCPAEIIHIQDAKAVVDLSKCISCFCCHEVCPEDAVEIKVPFIAKMLFREKSGK
ncbi:DUF362 domain-containing protein [Proteocatella sphenisci]|uniref:DUF362 domain-containing protein n=1 Tax=Proteocatella sphenisci TaxID=181070 RepID=UPI00048A4EE5|nr:DUF362 domain-containing protein [Proteocatella sphenisci]